jgi:CDP-4-dehydro-6-deoxyglucose reductase
MTLGPEPLEWIAGQYVELSPPGDERSVPYSIACAPDPEHPGRLELAVASGSSSGLLDDVAVGASLDVTGPLGQFVRSPSDGGAEVYIGTGTGLAPLRAMLQTALAEASDAPLVVLFGVRAEPEILWRDEMEALAKELPRFTFEPTLSQAQNGWPGRRGRVQDHLADLVAPHSAGRAYVCGVSEMVTETVSLLTEQYGFSPDRVFKEKH